MDFRLLPSQVDMYYKRNVELVPYRQVKIIVGVVLFILVIFGLVGLRSTVISINDRQVLRNSLVDLEKDVTKKDKALSDAAADLDAVEKKLPLLREAVPDNEDMKNYLESFVQTSGQAGFIIDSLHKQNAIEGNQQTITIRSKLIGNPANLPQLVNGLESQIRITQIVTVEIKDTIESDTEISVTMKVFSLDKKLGLEK